MAEDLEKSLTLCWDDSPDGTKIVLLCRVQNSSDGSSVRGFDQQDPAVCEKAPAAIQSVPATCGAAL